ncbi:helix-turn-helix domain-containing protein [Nocardia brasiliensis]|uniref:helix-turn-helix domain-containing protein n=1 Tax=Nocardia brasiliensis TaxID=37326 RepID=UPI002455E125|nr:helix-turn-helix domain-containing protein [Nocardia brasiliensis]
MAEPEKPSLASVLHQPVRWRIAQALIGREMTTGQLAAHLDDVAHATLYRHVNVLLDAGIVDVVAERKVRGTTERTLRLHVENPAAANNEVVGADEVRGFFTVYVAGVAGSLDRYLQRDDIDPARDGLALRQSALWLADDEMAEFAERFRRFLEPYLSAQDNPNRSRRILSTILMPDA